LFIRLAFIATIQKQSKQEFPVGRMAALATHWCSGGPMKGRHAGQATTKKRSYAYTLDTFREQVQAQIVILQSTFTCSLRI